MFRNAERNNLQNHNTHHNRLDRNSSIRTNSSDESCWSELSNVVNNDTSSEGEDESDFSVASTTTRNSNLRLSLSKAKHRLSFDKWRGGNNSQSPPIGNVAMHSPTEVSSPDSPSGRLSRWFSIRRGSSHNYDVGGKDVRGGSLEKEIKSSDRTSKMPQLTEVRGLSIIIMM